MKICSTCHNIVTDSDGMKLANGNFYCESSGCKKEYLDEVFEKQVIPDLMRTGTVLRIGSSSKPLKFQTFHKGPAEFFKKCENCQKVRNEGHRYYFYYGYKDAAPANVPPEHSVRLGKSDYLIAGRESAYLCTHCVKRPQQMSALWKIIVLLLALPTIGYLLYSLNTKYLQYFFLGIFLPILGFIVYLIFTLKDNPEQAERLAIRLKQKPFLQQGFTTFLSESNFKKLYYSR